MKMYLFYKEDILITNVGSQGTTNRNGWTARLQCPADLPEAGMRPPNDSLRPKLPKSDDQLHLRVYSAQPRVHAGLHSHKRQSKRSAYVQLRKVPQLLKDDLDAHFTILVSSH